MKATARFVIQAVILGLAIAFVLTLIWPQLRQAPTDTAPVVSIRESAPESAPLPLTSGPVSYAAAVEKAAPAVVNINTAKVVTVRPHPFFNDPFFRQFFGGSDQLIRPRQKVETSLGSGVIVSDTGYILTNHHVIDGADAIQVALRDGRTAEARVVGSDAESDIAVLKVDLAKLPVITLGQSEGLRIGDVVLAIGNPFGVGQTVTMGIVSATGRSHLGINTFENFIQTDAAINPGNSGGALVNARGELVGVNTAIFSKSGGYQGIGFAIPTSMAKTVLEDIIQHGRALRGWLGVEARMVNEATARQLGVEPTDGLIVTGVVRGGPAHSAGLQPGDAIISIDGKNITEARDAFLAIATRRPGDKVTMRIRRGGKESTLQVVAIERPQQAARRP
ncbi:MAG: Do family serine endopeptidase [Pseudomonadota bacterium]|nr:MAG: Do family serine endopeptidase [Pseudomonadota bacterium]